MYLQSDLYVTDLLGKRGRTAAALEDLRNDMQSMIIVHETWNYDELELEAQCEIVTGAPSESPCGATISNPIKRIRILYSIICLCFNVLVASKFVQFLATLYLFYNVELQCLLWTMPY